MRVLVFGSRTYNNRVLLFKTLDDLHATTPITVIIQGEAKGADNLAKQWANNNRIPTEDYDADWNDMQTTPMVARQRADGSWYNAAAGGIRNRRMMVEGKPDIAVEFPGGKGTMNMRGICRAELKLRSAFRHITVMG